MASDELLAEMLAELRAIRAEWKELKEILASQQRGDGNGVPRRSRARRFSLALAGKALVVALASGAELLVARLVADGSHRGGLYHPAAAPLPGDRWGGRLLAPARRPPRRAPTGRRSVGQADVISQAVLSSWARSKLDDFPMVTCPRVLPRFDACGAAGSLTTSTTPSTHKVTAPRSGAMLRPLRHFADRASAAGG